MENSFSFLRPINLKSGIRNCKCAKLVFALLLAGSVTVNGQEPKRLARIGFLSEGFRSSNVDSLRIEAFRHGLRELGYSERKSISIEYRFAEGKRERLPELAAELVRLKMDVLVTYGTVGTLALKKATSTIPIVMAGSADPVGRGIVASLPRPGGNVTGLSSLSADLSGKRLELLKETVPRLTRVGVLWSPSADYQLSSANFKDTETAARTLSVQVESLEVRSLADFDRALKTATERGVRGLLTMQTPLTTAYGGRIVELAAKNQLPTMFNSAVYAEIGGLMSYAPDIADIARRSAVYVDKILKGAKPAELPVEQPTKFELVINLKTAKQIGLTIPPNVLARADRVIR
jgi:putative ABC transport system substrate-binding protein